VYTAAPPPATDPGRAAPGGGASAAAPTGPSAELAAVLGTLVWPLAFDGASLLSSAYGDRVHPRAGSVRFHSGLDLRAPAGTPVHAAADGVVLASGTAGAYGWRVIVDHGAGLHSLYAHHSRNLVVAGQRVRRGQVIALVGRTGNATGDHLHFELRWRDGVVDPKVVLPALARAPGR
jgi:murein DD-endopeptidase MepM/ murein hydrolase activator NlpD